jgi:hypothetical protein
MVRGRCDVAEGAFRRAAACAVCRMRQRLFLRPL